MDRKQNILRKNKNVQKEKYFEEEQKWTERKISLKNKNGQKAKYLEKEQKQTESKIS